MSWAQILHLVGVAILSAASVLIGVGVVATLADLFGLGPWPPRGRAARRRLALRLVVLLLPLAGLISALHALLTARL